MTNGMVGAETRVRETREEYYSGDSLATSVMGALDPCKDL